MKGIKQIEKELREVAKSNNLTGDSVELMIKLLAYNQYESNISTQISLLEALPNRAVHQNSKIEHAVNQMYSLFRGTNANIHVKVKVTGNLSLQRFEKIYSDKRNTFYYSHVITAENETIYGDYDFTYGKTYTLVLIKSDEIIEETLSVDIDNVYLLETLSGNISEDYSLRSSLNTSIDLSTTKIFGDHINNSLTPEDDAIALHFDLTTSDYGLRVYSPLVEGFNNSLTYTLKYIPFNAEVIDSSTFSSMTFKGLEIDYDSFLINEPVTRESVENFLYNLKKNALVQSRVRSNSDVLDEFKSLFTSKILDCNIGDYNLETDTLTINYIPKDSDSPQGTPSLYEVSQAEKDLYISKLMYYVTKDVNLVPLYDHSNSVSLHLEVNMVVDKRIDTSLLNNYLVNLEYKLGESLKLDQFVGFINNIDGVRYADLKVSDSDNNLITENVDLNKDQYFLLLNNFTYSYKL